MSRGKFITVEGGEGVGKSTHVNLLVDALRRNEIDVIATREPGGAPRAEQIRAMLIDNDTAQWDAMTEVLLHFSARSDHLTRTVLPALERGQWVVSDRFADSTMAYQSYGHGIERTVVETLYKLVVGELIPDVTLIFDMPAVEGLRRALVRSGRADRYEQLDVDFHERVRLGFLDIASREPERCMIISAGSTIDDTAEAVLKAVNSCIDTVHLKKNPVDTS